MRKKLFSVILLGVIISAFSFPVSALEVVSESPLVSSSLLPDDFSISDYLQYKEDMTDDFLPSDDVDPEQAPTDGDDFPDDSQQPDGDEVSDDTEQQPDGDETPEDGESPDGDTVPDDQPETDVNPSDSLAADVAEIRASLGILIESNQPFFADEVEKQSFYDNLAAIRRDLDILVYAVIPVAAAVFLFWKFCQWFYRTFVESALE